MRVGEFIVPCADEWVDSLGVAPEPEDADEDVQRIVYESSSGGVMILTYAPGNAIRFRWKINDTVLIDIYREGARRILTRSGRGEAWVTIECEVEELKGELRIKLEPDFSIDDVLLFV